MRFGGLGNYTYLCAPFERIDIAYWIGEVVEWSITAVLKTVDVKASGGSNPSLSAIKGVNQAITRFTPFFTPKKQFEYFCNIVLPNVLF